MVYDSFFFSSEFKRVLGLVKCKHRYFHSAFNLPLLTMFASNSKFDLRLS